LKCARERDAVRERAKRREKGHRGRDRWGSGGASG
jgi:hypothetical protein